MKREPKQCRQCGREIYFDGICVSCRAENERNKILALTQEEITAKIRQICNEIEHKGKLDEEENMFRKLLINRHDKAKLTEVR